MSVTVNGTKHPTMKEAAPLFGVTAKQVYEWIKDGVIPPPPRVKKGRMAVMVFPDEYMKEARRRVAGDVRK